MGNMSGSCTKAYISSYPATPAPSGRTPSLSAPPHLSTAKSEPSFLARITISRSTFMSFRRQAASSGAVSENPSRQTRAVKILSLGMVRILREMKA